MSKDKIEETQEEENHVWQGAGNIFIILSVFEIIVHMKPLPSLTASISRGPEACPRTKQTLFSSGAAQTVCMSYLLPDAHRGSA